MSAKNKALVKRWFKEVWDKGRVEAIDEMYHPKGRAHGLTEGGTKPLLGPNAFKPFHAKLRAALPDVKIKVVDAIAEGDKVVVRCQVTATHKGDSLGIAATKKKVMFEGVTIVRCKEGKIFEGWNFYDFMKMYMEIGLLKK